MAIKKSKPNRQELLVETQQAIHEFVEDEVLPVTRTVKEQPQTGTEIKGVFGRWIFKLDRFINNLEVAQGPLKLLRSVGRAKQKLAKQAAQPVAVSRKPVPRSKQEKYWREVEDIFTELDQEVKTTPVIVQREAAVLPEQKPKTRLRVPQPDVEIKRPKWVSQLDSTALESGNGRRRPSMPPPVPPNFDDDIDNDDEINEFWGRVSVAAALLATDIDDMLIEDELQSSVIHVEKNIDQIGHLVGLITVSPPENIDLVKENVSLRRDSISSLLRDFRKKYFDRDRYGFSGSIRLVDEIENTYLLGLEELIEHEWSENDKLRMNSDGLNTFIFYLGLISEDLGALAGEFESVIDQLQRASKFFYDIAKQVKKDGRNDKREQLLELMDDTGIDAIHNPKLIRRLLIAYAEAIGVWMPDRV